MRLDTRRKLAYKPEVVKQRQKYILEGVLQVLKFNPSNDVENFVRSVRSDSRPQELAKCLKTNLQTLQVRGIIPAMNIDETDLVSLALQGLFSHRAARNPARPNGDISAGDPPVSVYDEPQSTTTSPTSTLYSNDHMSTNQRGSYWESDDGQHSASYKGYDNTQSNFKDEKPGSSDESPSSLSSGQSSYTESIATNSYDLTAPNKPQFTSLEPNQISGYHGQNNMSRKRKAHEVRPFPALHDSNHNFITPFPQHYLPQSDSDFEMRITNPQKMSYGNIRTQHYGTNANFTDPYLPMSYNAPPPNIPIYERRHCTFLFGERG